MRILVIDDEPITQQYLKTGLTTSGFVVDLADNGVDGQHLALTGGYDLIILDVMMPGISGWDVLRAVRQTIQTPVLILSGCHDVDDRTKGLNLGADDYLVKPFAFAELLARIHALLRRAPLREEEHLRLADLEIDVLKRRVTRAGERLELTAKEFNLLHLFATHPGEVLCRTLIASQVWDMNFDSDTNVVDVAIRRLRAKIDDPFSKKLVHTVRGMGYLMEERD